MKKIVCALFILAFLAGYVYAEKGSAAINDMEGDVFVKKAADKEEIFAEVDMELQEGDEVITKEKGSVDLIFDDDSTIIRLSENTNLVVKKIEKDKTSHSSLLELIKGKIVNIVNKVSGVRKSFEVKTPTAVAAVKGTEFAVEATDKESYVGVFKGEVNVSGFDAAGNKLQEVGVKEEKEIKVDKNNRNYAPQILTWRMQKAKEIRFAILKNLITYQSLKKSGELEKIRTARKLYKARDLVEFLKTHPGAFGKMTETQKERTKTFLHEAMKLKETVKVDELRNKYPLLIEKFRQIQRQRFEKFKDIQSMQKGREPGKKGPVPQKTGPVQQKPPIRK